MTAPREVARTAPGDAVTTRLTINGRPAEFALPARVTLADALRDRLGLTGTHVGCEHGVCGMCTVLVDGAAARSCLMLACQADGADIMTVEGLGTPAQLHPLQQSFGRHHALQCGFCTPGFLLSAYDLLTHDPQVRAEDLPAELSGVICRCTGYRNIVAAVAAVADGYRTADGASRLPGPAFIPRTPAFIPRTPAFIPRTEAADLGPAPSEQGAGYPAPGQYPDRIVGALRLMAAILARRLRAPLSGVARRGAARRR